MATGSALSKLLELAKAKKKKKEEEAKKKAEADKKKAQDAANRLKNIGQGYSYVSGGIGYEVSPGGTTKVVGGTTAPTKRTGGGGGTSKVYTGTALPLPTEVISQQGQSQAQLLAQEKARQNLINSANIQRQQNILAQQRLAFLARQEEKARLSKEPLPTSTPWSGKVEKVVGGVPTETTYVSGGKDVGYLRTLPTGEQTYSLPYDETNLIKIDRGKLTYKNKNYKGNEVVPNTGGKTASQLLNESWESAKSQLGRNTKINEYSVEYALPSTTGGTSQLTFEKGGMKEVVSLSPSEYKIEQTSIPMQQKEEKTSPYYEKMFVASMKNDYGSMISLSLGEAAKGADSLKNLVSNYANNISVKYPITKKVYDKLKELNQVKISSISLNVPVDKDGNIVVGAGSEATKWIPFREMFPNKKKVSISEFEELTGLRVPLPKTLIEGYVGVVAVTGGAGAKILGMSAKKVASFTLSKYMTTPVSKVYESIPTPEGFLKVPAQFAKASLASFLITRSPALSTAYAGEFLKGGITQPGETIRAFSEQITERPAEFAGFLVGGALAKKGLEKAELKLRRKIETKTVELPGYGEVIVQKIPKYKEVVWIKGVFSQSEKVGIIKQINKLLGNKERIFVNISPRGVTTGIFSNTKNLGFEVSQLSNPLRGLYEAPPFEFLKKYKNLVRTEAGALSYYAEGLGRESLLPNPAQAFKSLFSPEGYTTQRPFEYVERTYKGIKTPKWIKEVADSLSSGKGIPNKYKVIIDKYYKKFLDTPIEYKGKVYQGLEKQNLVNRINLRTKGSGVKLKVYASLLEYQNANKVTLVGGAELLSGISPFGSESQIVRSLGTRIFLKSGKDLRKGIKPSFGRDIVELVTGTKRGQYVAEIDGTIVEIQPIRSFPGKVGVSGRSTPIKVETNIIDNIINTGKSKRITKYYTPPRPMTVGMNLNNVLVSSRDIKREELPPNIKRVSIRREEVRNINNLIRPTPRVIRKREIVNIPIARVTERANEPNVLRRIIKPTIEERRRELTRRNIEPVIINRLTPKRIIESKIRRREYALSSRIQKRRAFEKQVLPTAFEQLMGGVKKGQKAKKKITGFESMRFR